MHQMRTIATDGPVVWCVCQSATRLCAPNVAERIEVLFGGEDSWGSSGPNIIVLDGGPEPPRKGEERGLMLHRQLL